MTIFDMLVVLLVFMVPDFVSLWQAANAYLFAGLSLVVIGGVMTLFFLPPKIHLTVDPRIRIGRVRMVNPRKDIVKRAGVLPGSGRGVPGGRRTGPHLPLVHAMRNSYGGGIVPPALSPVTWKCFL